jgi:hypothetical protein
MYRHAHLRRVAPTSRDCHVLFAILRRHLTALCDRRPGGRDGVSGIDGVCRVSVDRDASNRACAQHRGCDVLDLGLPRKGCRLEDAAAASARRCRRPSLAGSSCCAGRASLQNHDRGRIASRRRGDDFSSGQCRCSGPRGRAWDLWVLLESISVKGRRLLRTGNINRRYARESSAVISGQL